LSYRIICQDALFRVSFIVFQTPITGPGGNPFQEMPPFLLCKRCPITDELEVLPEQLKRIYPEDEGVIGKERE